MVWEAGTWTEVPVPTSETPTRISCAYVASVCISGRAPNIT